MSELVTLTTATATIYGSRAGARAYLGAEREEWDLANDAAVTVDMKRALVKAMRFLDRLAWGTAYLTFAARDAVTAIVNASYELGALVYDDDTALDDASDASEVTSVSAGGDSVSYAVGVKRPPVPGVAYALIAPYLATAVDDAALDGSDGLEGSETNPFSLSPDEDAC
jgi:hypothetical protein